MDHDGGNFGRIPALGLRDERLIGCEPITLPIRRDGDGEDVLRAAWAAAQRARRIAYLVRDDEGREAIWQHENDFWQ